MKVKEIRTIVNGALDAGWVMEESIHNEIAALYKPVYRIALVGEFQVGKSLLADQVYLQGAGLIRSGVGLPTTSVVSEVEYGENSKLEVIYKDCGEPLVINNPGADEIAEYTTAKTEEARTALSEKIEKVVLTVPDEKLKNYTIMDTPGIDDPNESVMVNSTLPQLLTADAVILMMPPRSLDSVEKKFLQGFLFEKSISRVMVMISYNPQHPLGKKTRQEIVQNVKAELNMMGRGYIPVQICCYDDSVDEALNSPEKIREAIHDFAIANVQQGRLQRVIGVLLNSFGAYENQLRARLRLAQCTQDEIKELEKKLKEAEQLLYRRLRSAMVKIADKEVEVTDSMTKSMHGAMERINAVMLERFSRCSDLSEIQNELEAVKVDLENSVKNALNSESARAKVKMEEVLFFIDEELRAAADELVAVHDFGYDINIGHLGKLNSGLVLALDYLLVAILSPFGLIFDLIFRYILGRLPLIRHLLPTAFVKRKVLKTIEESLSEISRKVESDISAQFKQAFQRIREDITSHFEQLYQTTVKPILEEIEKAKAGSVSSDEIEEIVRKLRRICEASQQLLVVLG